MMICIDEKKCVGCGRCIDICPGNLLTIKNSRAACRDVRDCWGCCACVKICPKGAIAYQLSADLGGAGAKLFAHDEPKKLTWQILKTDGEKIFLTVDKTQANKF
ncbi:MAG: 4Fe-4S binding protein [Selenomonadaceae bacterium]|nr:4Fe-4S binding protein [Selenomonadaceae bacterium]